MDGRRETVYPDDIYEQHLDFVAGIGDWDQILDDYDSHLALVYRSGAARNLIRLKEGWELIYEDGTSSLFALPGMVRIR